MDGGGWRQVLGSRSGIFTWWPARDSGQGTRQFTSDLVLPQICCRSFAQFGQGFHIHDFPLVAFKTA